MSEASALLKEIIDKNGPDYISEHPFEVYSQLIESHADPSVSRLILLTLLSKTAEKAQRLDQSALSKDIQKECCLRKSAADQMADLYKELYSRENMQKWSEKNGSGLKEFCSRQWNFKWNCTKEYHQSGAYVDCTCRIEAEFRVSNSALLEAAFQKELEKNPFLSSDQIEKRLNDLLGDQLDEDVDQYVNGDDYYEPWMPDYDCSDILEQFCRKYGLELLDYSCDGDTSDWQREW